MLHRGQRSQELIESRVSICPPSHSILTAYSSSRGREDNSITLFAQLTLPCRSLAPTRQPEALQLCQPQQAQGRSPGPRSAQEILHPCHIMESDLSPNQELHQASLGSGMYQRPGSRVRAHHSVAAGCVTLVTAGEGTPFSSC